MNPIEVGNVHLKQNGQRDWIIGHFIEPASPFHSTDFEVKWSRFSSGEKKDQAKANKTAKSIAILGFGKFELHFPELNKTVVLEREGDYVFFDSKVVHQWESLEDTLLVTLRWPSIPGDQE